MPKRQVIKIDEDKCTGCGLCVTACAEGALAIVDGKARVVSEIFCDGLGACLGQCPEGALTVEEREAPQFDEQAVKRHLAAAAAQVAATSECGCPGARAHSLAPAAGQPGQAAERVASRLSHWPVQLRLVPTDAPYLQGADVLIAADCVPFAYAEFHRDFLQGRVVLVGCPKLDDLAYYTTKLTELFRVSDVRSVTVLKMEVPCCSGIARAAEQALVQAGRAIPFEVVTVGIDGSLKRLPHKAAAGL